MSQSGKVFTDPLFVGLTRPRMLFGVSYTFFMLNALVGLLGFVLLDDNKSYLAILVLFNHALGYYLCSKEPLFIELFMIQSSKCNRSKNIMFRIKSTIKKK